MVESGDSSVYLSIHHIFEIHSKYLPTVRDAKSNCLGRYKKRILILALVACLLHCTLYTPPFSSVAIDRSTRQATITIPPVDRHWIRSKSSSIASYMYNTNEPGFHEMAHGGFAGVFFREKNVI